MMEKLKIIEYIEKYGLDKAILDFNLICKDDGKRILLKYNQISSPMGIEEVQECRGLILEKNTWKILCLSFKKFFNAEEGHAAKIDWDTAHILEKMDGSLIQLYNYEDEWVAATSGTISGEGEVNNKGGTTFNKLFWDTVNNKYSFNDCLLDKDHIYVFELTTPYNIVVKPHGESSVTLLAMRNRKTLHEVAYEDLKMVCESLNVPLVKAFDMNVKDVGAIKRTFDGMPFHEEGYVVVDGKFNRIKIKNPAYVAVHHLKSKTSEHAIMDIVKSNEIEEFSATFPERKEEIFKLYDGYNNLINTLEDAWSKLQDKRPKNITPKEKKKFAMAVFELIGDNDTDLKPYSGMFFGINDGKVESVKEYLRNYDNKKLYHTL
jgi:hypothetical protein